MNTIEGNEIIANFLGWKFERQWFPEGVTFVPFGWTVPIDDPLYNKAHTNEHLYFNDSWDWLMPVVEKMSTIHYGWDNMETPYDDCCYPRTFGMLNAEGKPMVRFNSSQVFTADTLIEATWLSVVDFIQWYNNQTNTNKNNKS